MADTHTGTTDAPQSREGRGRLVFYVLLLGTILLSLLMWVTFTTDGDELDAPNQIGPPERTGLFD